MAAVTGVALLAGCSAESGSAAGVGADQPVAAKPSPNGGFVVAGAAGLRAGQAMAFTFPDGNPGLVFVTTSGTKGALSSKCTHSGCTVEWRPQGASEELQCPCHDSKFDPTGKVLGGPAKADLARYTVAVQGEDVLLTPA